MAARSRLTISERQVVQTLIANTTGPRKKGLVNAYCPNVTALYEVAASVKENLHEFMEEPKKSQKAQVVEGVTGVINKMSPAPRPFEQWAILASQQPAWSHPPPQQQ